MSFLKTMAEEEAEGDVAAMYAADIEHNGYLPNYSRIFSLHPGAYQAWGGLILSIRGAMDRRRYELATMGAANQLRSTYCSLAHVSVLEGDSSRRKSFEESCRARLRQCCPMSTARSLPSPRKLPKTQRQSAKRTSPGSARRV